MGQIFKVLSSRLLNTQTTTRDLTFPWWWVLHNITTRLFRTEFQKSFTALWPEGKATVNWRRAGLWQSPAPTAGRRAARFPSYPGRYRAGPRIRAPRAHVLSRREFTEEMKSSSAGKILTDLTSMNSTFSKQDEQGDFSLHSGILKSSLQAPCWMRLDTKGSLKRAWGRF